MDNCKSISADGNFSVRRCCATVAFSTRFRFTRSFYTAIVGLHKLASFRNRNVVHIFFFIFPFFFYFVLFLIVSLSHRHQVLAIFVVISLVNAQIRPLITTRDRDAVILKQIYDLNPDGSYLYSYETSNGIAADQQGYLKNRGSQLEAQVRRFYFIFSLAIYLMQI